MSDLVKIDTSQFKAAIMEYARFDRRELPAIINAKLGDWAWEAARIVQRTTKDVITAGAFRNGGLMWWKFINTVINAGYILKGRRKANDAEAAQGYYDAPTGKWIARRKTLSTFRNTAENRKKKDYARVSRSILKRRAATVKSFVAQFLFAALKLGKNVATVGGKNSWKYQGLSAERALSGAEKPHAIFSIPWRARTLENKRHEGARSSRENRKLSIATDAIEKARARVIADMQQKTAERYARKAAQLSGRA